MKKKRLVGCYFYGNKPNEYAITSGYLDYETLAKAFPHILNNDIIRNTAGVGSWDIVNGSEYIAEDDFYVEVFQYYIISEEGARILEYYTDELVYYNEDLGLYVWGVTHFGTAWSHVLTDIHLNCGYE